ncbi:MAG: isocitrate lyase, partial [Pseudomonadota bacterium]
MTTFGALVPTPHANRFDGIRRAHSAEDVARLRGSIEIRYTLAERGANRLWESLKTEPYINSLGAVTGNQAVQMARAGLQAIYLSGWQVAADANTASQTYPDQ